MGIHHELVELVERAGPAVLQDAHEFRAAFDDFVLEGVATEGDLNLLTDAIRLGALQRVVDQIAQGADPERSIETQGDRLALQRGTQESAGARWALAALAFALGEVGESAVSAQSGLVRPLPPPPVAPPTVVSPTRPAPADERPATAARRTPRPGRARGRRLLVGTGSVVLVLAIAAGAAFVLTRDRGAGDSPERSRPSTPTAVEARRVLPTGHVTAARSVTLPAADQRIVLAGRVGGVSLEAFGTVERIGVGEAALYPDSGSRLLGFTLGRGPCQERPCRDWRRLGLQVMIDGKPTRLPGGGPTYVVAAPSTARVELRYDADGFDQRVSLADGRATGENIRVLARRDRTTDVGATKQLRPTANVLLDEDAVRAVKVGRAELFFFDGRKPVGRPDQAFLRIDVTYTTPKDPTDSLFYEQEVHLEDSRGRPFPRRNLGAPDHPDTVFVVPASFQRGTLVISGTREASEHLTDGSVFTFRLTLPRTTFAVRF